MTHSQQGYTYFGVLLLVMVLGMALSGAKLVTDTQQRREQEKELIFAGQQYVDAIRSYYESGSGGINTYPRSVSELLRDPRFPGVRRHLRKPWKDPMTPSGDWDMIVTEEGGIIGVRSRSERKPLGKLSILPEEGDAVSQTQPVTYRDWEFKYQVTTDVGDGKLGD